MANRGEKLESVADFIFLDSKINADGDCSHEIKKRLLLKRKKENGMIVSIDTEKAFHKIQKLFTSWQIDGERMETVRLYIFGLQNQCRW